MRGKGGQCMAGVSLSFESWRPSGPVTDKCRWPGLDLGGPDQNSMNHIFNYYFANEIKKNTTVYYFTNSFYCVFLQKN